MLRSLVIALLTLVFATSCASVRPRSQVDAVKLAVAQVLDEAAAAPQNYDLYFYCEPNPEFVCLGYSQKSGTLFFSQPLSGEDVDNPDSNDPFYTGAGLLPPEQIFRFEQVMRDHGFSTNRCVAIVGSSRYFSYDWRDLSDRSPEAVGCFVADIFRCVYGRSASDSLFYIMHKGMPQQDPPGDSLKAAPEE